MARYCFYCNKELQPGQRCDCRYSQKIQAAESSGSADANATRSDDVGARTDIPPAADDGAQAKRETRARRANSARPKETNRNQVIEMIAQRNEPTQIPVRIDLHFSAVATEMVSLNNFIQYY